MADDIVSLSGEGLKFGRSPAVGEQLVGNSSNGFTYTTFPVIWGNPIEFTNPVKVDGQVWSTTTGFKFPDGTTQASAATTYLPPTYTNNSIVSNVSGATAAASGNTLTQVLDATAGSAQGSILYRGASAWVPLAPGSNGQVLTTQGASANPIWTSQGWTRIVRTTTQSVTTSTFSDDLVLQFPVSANKVYEYRAVAFISGSPTGWKVSTNGPTSPTSLRFGLNALATTYTIYNTIVFTDTGASSVVTVPLVGTISNGANAGTVTITWSNVTSGTVFLYPGSWLEWAEVG